MRKPNLSKWESPEELEGLLIFAQALDEMLFDHTVDSYKAQALNLHTNLLELRFLAYQLNKKRITSGTLIPVLEELEKRIKDDQVFDKNHHELFSIYLNKLSSNRKKPAKLISLTNAMISDLNDFYWPLIKTEILNTVPNSKLKKKIISLAAIFVTEAELIGFHRNYIYYFVNNYFFNDKCEPKKIENENQLVDFLDEFYSESQKWLVVMRGEDTFSNNLDLSETLGLSITKGIPDQLPDDIDISRWNTLGEIHNYPIYITVDEIELKDPVSARDYAKRKLDIMLDIFSFITHSESPKIFEEALIHKKDTEYLTQLKPSQNPMKKGITRIEDMGDDEVERMLEILAGSHFDSNSTYLFIKSFDYHRAALETLTSENQLLDLWAALEGFLPPPSDDGNRISHYVDSLLPSLVLTYPEKLFLSITDSIKHGNDKVVEIIESSGVDGDFFEKCVSIISCDEFEDIRNGIYGELDHHPLLRFRVYTLHDQFNSLSHITQTNIEHKKRVSWHIQRIYTTRNQIIHNAQSLPYLDTLIENLHSYTDTLLRTVSIVGEKSRISLDISSSLTMLSVHEDKYLKRIDNGDIQTTKENFKEIIFGHDNPLNPFLFT
jgi:hypothetical protein